MEVERSHDRTKISVSQETSTNMRFKTRNSYRVSASKTISLSELELLSTFVVHEID